jgi:hypothetical protein
MRNMKDLFGPSDRVRSESRFRPDVRLLFFAAFLGAFCGVLRFTLGLDFTVDAFVAIVPSYVFKSVSVAGFLILLSMSFRDLERGLSLIAGCIMLLGAACDAPWVVLLGIAVIMLASFGIAQLWNAARS